MNITTVGSKSASFRNNDYNKIKTKDEYYLQNPSQQSFYNIIAFFMGILGMNSEHWGWYKRPASRVAYIAYCVQRIVFIIFTPITVFSQTLYLILNYKEHEFATLAVMFSIMPVGYVVSIKSASAQSASYKEANIAFMERIHLYNFISVKNFSEHKRNFIAQELVKVEKFTRRTFIFIMTSVLICFYAWNTVPIIHNLQNNNDIHNITKRLEVCVHFWMPFDYEFNFYGYLFIQVLGFYCGGVAVVMMVLFDTVNFAYINHLVGHIRIIKYDLRHGFIEQGLSEQDLRKRLVNIIKTYCFITDTFGMGTAAFGLNVASIYAQNLFQGGLLIYQIMTTGRNVETVLTFGLMIPIFMGILMLMSLILENVRIQADDIPALVYELPWESMSVSNQKILLIILSQVQPTLEFKAAFNIKTGVQPAINIIKTTFSYYVMIKSRNESE